MYFCEDHGSVSDDGTGTVLHFQGSEEPPGPLQSLSLPSPPRINGTLGVKPLLSQEQRHRLQLQPTLLQPAGGPLASSCGGGGSPGPPSDCGNRSSLDNEEDLAALQEAEASSPSAPNSQTSSSPPEQPQPPPSAAAAVSATAIVLPATGGGVNGLHRYVLQAATTAGCTYQEVREISLGRHNEEPFGMKIECVGEGFFITHVVRNSVAACAGLKVGDEIVRINDRRLEGLRTKEVLQVIRQSELCVKLAYKPRAVVARIREVRLKKDNGLLGLRLQKKPDGLYIDFVKRGTVAFEAGLKDGDQVLKINSHIVTDWSMEGAMALLKSLGDSEQLALLVRETLPIAHLTANQSAGQQTRPHENHEHPEDAPDVGNDGADDSTVAAASASRNGLAEDIPLPETQPPAPATTPPTPDDGRQKSTIRGSNPCASTDDLEITRLPPEDSETAAATAVAAAPAGPSGSFSSSFLKSFHAPSRLTAFLKSARITKQPASAAAPVATVSSSKDKGHIA